MMTLDSLMKSSINKFVGADSTLEDYYKGIINEEE